MKVVNVSNFTHNTISLKTSQILVAEEADGGGGTSIWRKVVHYHFPLFFRNNDAAQVDVYVFSCFLFSPHFLRLGSDNELLPIPKKEHPEIWMQLVNNMTLLKKNWGHFLFCLLFVVQFSDPFFQMKKSAFFWEIASKRMSEYYRRKRNYKRGGWN